MMESLQAEKGSPLVECDPPQFAATRWKLYALGMAEVPQHMKTPLAVVVANTQSLVRRGPRRDSLRAGK
jgi:hypothetical protein